MRLRFKAIVTILLLALEGAACGVLNRSAPASRGGESQSPSQQNPNSSNPAVQIDYSRASDFLSSLTVTKFTAAEMIPTTRSQEKAGTSIVRFEGGGVAVWEIDADAGVAREMLAEIPVVGSGGKYALKQVAYGMLPKGFTQTTPDSGPPEPIQSNNYYVFEVDRASGSVSFEAIKVLPDGSFQAYDAQPRAGESYALCCNVNSDFVASGTP